LSLIVQKYGGTSVANIERIKAVAERVAKTIKEGNSVIVVVSAMSGETDKLIGFAQQISPNPSEREMDLLLSSGERVTSALTAMAIEALGHKARAFSGRQAGIITDTVHTKARIAKITGERIKKAIADGYAVVIAGFQGVTEGESDVTTLGRGGSDLSAVAVAAAVNAELCEIYTDVDGVYTTDPNIVPEARKLEKISYEEMLELASLGAKVLQTRSVEFAKKYKVPVVVMHIKGKPRDMQINPVYEALIPEILDYLRGSIKLASDAGIPDNMIVIDPGIGFGKTFEQNLNIIHNLQEFALLEKPVLIGVSRKAFIGKILGDAPAGERLEGTAAACTIGILRGANILRVHDVKFIARIASMTDAIIKS